MPHISAALPSTHSMQETSEANHPDASDASNLVSSISNTSQNLQTLIQNHWHLTQINQRQPKIEFSMRFIKETVAQEDEEEFLFEGKVKVGDEICTGWADLSKDHFGIFIASELKNSPNQLPEEKELEEEYLIIKSLAETTIVSLTESELITTGLATNNQLHFTA